MKIVVKKEFDGSVYVGSCENVPGCYTQGHSEDEVKERLQRALLLIKRKCEQRRQPFPTGSDRPILDVRIKFNTLSTDQLVKILESYRYHLVHVDDESALLINREFPFNLIHLPRSNSLSPLLVKKIFGADNTQWVGAKKMKLSKSVS
jgi:predicted RNase H-like HicB family nuclease